MNTFEKVFIVFAAAFALEEYTASKEHGWTSEFHTCHSHNEHWLTYGLVYIANVSRLRRASRNILTHGSFGMSSTPLSSSYSLSISDTGSKGYIPEMASFH